MFELGKVVPIQQNLLLRYQEITVDIKKIWKVFKMSSAQDVDMQRAFQRAATVNACIELLKENEKLEKAIREREPTINKLKPYVCRFDGMAWPMVNQEISELAYELRHGSNKNIIAASIIDAYIELVTCSPRKRKHIIKNINYYSNMINQNFTM